MISIIIPVYNVEQYISSCLQSLINQSLSDWECILVDDGSTDESPQLCDEYASRDARIRVIHRPNGGLSDARNAGMRVVRGKWIYFIDSDDWIHPEALQQLRDFAVKNHCEVVQGNLYYTYKDHLLYRQTNKKELRQHVFDREEAMRLLIVNDRIKNFAWGKLYRADIIRDLDFPVGKYFEDIYWQHLVMHRVKQYGIIDEPLYYYRQRESGISGEFSERNLDLLKGYEDRIRFIHEHYPQYDDLMLKMYSRTVQSVCLIGSNCGITAYDDYKKDAETKYNLKEYRDGLWNLVEGLACKIWNRLFGSNYKKVVL